MILYARPIPGTSSGPSIKMPVTLCIPAGYCLNTISANWAAALLFHKWTVQVLRVQPGQMFCGGWSRSHQFDVAGYV